MTAPISSSSGTAGTTGTTGTTSTTPSTTSSGTGVPSSIPFQFSGLASGLDTASIVQKLLAVYTAPEQIVQQQEATTLQDQTAWQDIQTKMTALQTAIQNLQAPAAAAGRTGSATPPAGSTAAVSITATPNAALGNFTVNVQSLATTGNLTGAAAMSAPITGAASTTAPITSLNMGVTPTTGTFTINGTQIAVDSATTLLGASGDTLQAKLATAGVTMTAVTDGSGNVTGVHLSSATALQLGASSDTSNMLAALRLTTAVPSMGGTVIQSNGSLSGSSLNAALGSLHLATSLTGTSGAFTVNGVSISYNSGDTLGSIIGKINQSTAGVTASYDPLGDQMVLTANATGGGGISVADTSGNLAAAFKMTTGACATVTPGAPAVFTVSGVNGGNPIASATNTVTGILSGVTLNLLAASPSMTPAGATTVTISQDSTALSTALQSFVTAYNAVQDSITQYTGVQTNSSGNVQNAGLLSGDPTLQSLAQSLDQTVNDTTVTFTGKQYSLASLGISTPSTLGIGAAAVPSLDLQFTAATLTSALAATPSLGQSFTGNGTISSQNGTLFNNLNTLLNDWTSPMGNIGTTLDSLATQYTNQQQQIQQWQDFASAEQTQLTNSFTAMETAVAQLQAQGQAMSFSLGTATTNSTNTSGTSSGTSSTGGTIGG